MAHFPMTRVFSMSFALLAVLIGGTCGFVLLEDWPLIDSFYMTLITISTVGYGEIHELSQIGRAFASGLICLSMVLMVWWTAGVTSVLVSNDLSGSLLKKKDLLMISKLTNHIVVCGGGIMARTIIAGLVLVNQLLGQGLLIYALPHFPPLVIGVALLTQPAVAALVGYSAFGEVLAPMDLLGMALLAGALVMARTQSRSAPDPGSASLSKPPIGPA